MASNQKKANSKRAREREKLLAMVPDDANRIGVVDEFGKQRWRALDEVATSDTIRVKKNGAPVVMKAKPGRRDGRSKRGPANHVVAQAMRDKRRALREDPLLGLVRKKPESTDVLQGAMVGLAEEASSIAFERQEAERKGEPTSQISTRRINALKAVVDTWLRRKEQLVARTIDMESLGFQTVMGFVMETFRGAMKEARLSEDQIKVIFSRFSKRVGSEEWKQEAKNRMTKDL